LLQVANKSPFVPQVSVLADETGVETLYVVVRGTFDLAPNPKAAEQQLPPAAGDVYWGDPATSSLKYASEIHVGKRGTDVVLLGHAYPPGERPVPEMLVALSVAGRQKVVQVIGDRTWRTVMGGFTHPEPFAKMPLLYERSFGGRHDDGKGHVSAEERNPVGTGFRGRRSLAEAGACKVPNLEDPRRLLKGFGDQPPPVGFGFVAPSWQPRRAHAGTYDHNWQKDRSPYLPKDFDRRFDNAATPDLVFDPFLVGGEPLIITGLSPEGTLRLPIPKANPSVKVTIAGKREAPPVQLETVLIEPDERRLCLTWRAALACDKRALKIQSVTIEGGA
jgi:hypothetical protein